MILNYLITHHCHVQLNFRSKLVKCHNPKNCKGPKTALMLNVFVFSDEMSAKAVFCLSFMKIVIKRSDVASFISGSRHVNNTVSVSLKHSKSKLE